MIQKTTNPAYYEKLRERLRIREQEEKRRKDDASYFDKSHLEDMMQIYNEALNADLERKKLGFSTSRL